MSWQSNSNLSGTARKLYVHRAGDCRGGTMRVCLEPPVEIVNFLVQDEARQIDEFLSDVLPAWLYDALAERMGGRQ